MGVWLSRKSKLLESKQQEAETSLRESGKTTEYALAQWKAQVEEQTKPDSRTC